MAVIEHPPGDETQWDWVELPDPPGHWGWGGKACLLVGALAHSWALARRAVRLDDQPHLIQGLDQVTRALGGLHRGVAVRPDGHRRAPWDTGASPRRSPGLPSITACPCGCARRGAQKIISEEKRKIYT